MMQRGWGGRSWRQASPPPRPASQQQQRQRPLPPSLHRHRLIWLGKRSSPHPVVTDRCSGIALTVREPHHRGATIRWAHQPALGAAPTRPLVIHQTRRTRAGCEWREECVSFQLLQHSRWLPPSQSKLSRSCFGLLQPPVIGGEGPKGPQTTRVDD